MSLRVRFAPSPTGYLHVGGARTALFNWLLARRTAGTFILRVEDTDADRSSEEMVQAILDGMEWLGLHWDEGPHFQSRGLDRHRADVSALVESGAAYFDFTSPDELARLRTDDPDRALRFPREAADAVGADDAAKRSAAGEPHAVRFRVPDGETGWDDRVHGAMRFQNADLEDFVLLRTDGTPTYNLAVASDDAEQEISLVIRGDDHISNTPKQILIHEALGRSAPEYAHVPMILGPDGKRLSKRHGATAVGDYSAEGILSDAMANFLALLGWSPGTDEEVMTREQLVERFSIDRVLKKSAVFDPTKLLWLNGQHLSRTPPEELVERVLVEMGELETIARRESEANPEWFLGVLNLLKSRARRTVDLADQARMYLVDTIDYDQDAITKHWKKDPQAVTVRMEALRERFSDVAWREEPLESELRALAEELNVGAGKLIHPLRVAVTGQAVSPGIFEVLGFMGRERTLTRLDRALNRLRTMAPRDEP